MFTLPLVVYTLLFLTKISRQEVTPKLLIFTMDGFRWDYTDRFTTPNFAKLFNAGVRAQYMQPVFPSVTVPNLYTHVTGVYPGKHGLVNNNFYDSETNRTFLLNMIEQAPKYLQVEPIWVTYSKQNRKFAYLYKSSNTSSMFEGDFTLSDGQVLVDKAINLMVEKNYEVVWLYFSEPDRSGHEKGPYSKELNVTMVDAILGDAFSRLEEAHLMQSINIIIVSDHGMALSPPENRIYVNKCLAKANITCAKIFGNTIGNVYVGKNDIERTFRALKSCHPKLSVYRKEDIPKRFNYHSNNRLGQLILLADESWHYVTDLEDKKPSKYFPGKHGYDTEAESMQTVFFARGPSFKSNYVAPPFSAIHVYALICHITRLNPRQNDGSIESVMHVLREYSKNSGTTTSKTQAFLISYLCALYAYYLV